MSRATWAGGGPTREPGDAGGGETHEQGGGPGWAVRPVSRAAVLAAVAPPAVRAAHWWPFAAALVVGYGLVAAPAVVPGPTSPDVVVILLRLAALCAGLGVGFLLDDPARPTTATAPSPAWFPLVARVAVGGAATAAWWFAALATGRAAASAEAAPTLLRGDLTLEAATVVLVGLAAATVVWRRVPRGQVGLVAAPAFLVLVFAAPFLPHRAALLVTLADPAWAAAHDRWAVALVVVAVTTVLAATWSPRPLRRAAPARQ